MFTGVPGFCSTVMFFPICHLSLVSGACRCYSKHLRSPGGSAAVSICFVQTSGGLLALQILPELSALRWIFRLIHAGSSPRFVCGWPCSFGGAEINRNHFCICHVKIHCRLKGWWCIIVGSRPFSWRKRKIVAAELSSLYVPVTRCRCLGVFQIVSLLYFLSDQRNSSNRGVSGTRDSFEVFSGLVINKNA